MQEIKVIRLDREFQFENEVNRMISEGWIVQKLDCIMTAHKYSDGNQYVIVHSVAFLLKEKK